MTPVAELTSNQWGMVLSADQNGFFAIHTGEGEAVVQLVLAGWFMWRTTTSVVPVLTPEAKKTLKARENVHRAKDAINPRREWDER